MFSVKVLRTSILIFSGIGLLIGFQNCSKVSVADPAADSVTLASSTGDGSDGSSSVSDGSDSPACDAANMHKQYLLNQLVIAGVAQDLSSLQQNLQIQFIHDGNGLVCDSMSIKVQGEGLCTAFHGILLESQDPTTKAFQDLFSIQPASSNSSACKAGSLEEQVYNSVLNALNHADSVDFQANGELVVKSRNVMVVFLTKHSQI